MPDSSIPPAAYVRIPVTQKLTEKPIFKKNNTKFVPLPFSTTLTLIDYQLLMQKSPNEIAIPSLDLTKDKKQKKDKTLKSGKKTKRGNTPKGDAPPPPPEFMPPPPDDPQIPSFPAPPPP